MPRGLFVEEYEYEEGEDAELAEAIRCVCVTVCVHRMHCHARPAGLSGAILLRAQSHTGWSPLPHVSG